jgi:peptide chain release factor 1
LEVTILVYYLRKGIMAIIVEIRSGEGGDDAKDLVQWQFQIYTKYADRKNLDIEILEERKGIIVFRVGGKGADTAFSNEAGGHRVQRIPPTEKRGRVQTSTITVAVLPIPTSVECNLPEKDIRITTCRGSGSGGQHRNVTDSAVQILHIPTGLLVRSESERSQYLNKEMALDVMRARLQARAHERAYDERRDKRKQQIGSGMRADKRRTIRVRDGTVKDHVTGDSWDYKKYKRGDWD